VELNFPPGIVSGYKIRYAGLGDDGNEELPRGDLIVNISLVLPENHWVERHNLLCTKIKINVWQAMTGHDYLFNNFDGKILNVKIPAGTQPGTKLRLRNQGMLVNKNLRADLCIVIEVDIPKVEDSASIDLIEQLKTTIQ
jgi:DnaJ-class molecular chaperone